MPDQFEQEVRMWVYEEMINDRKLTEIINKDHENVKYLPGHKLPENVVCRLEIAFMKVKFECLGQLGLGISRL